MSLGLLASGLFLEIHGHLSFLAEDPPPFRDPIRIVRFIEDQVVVTWLLKLTIPSISEPLQLSTLTKAICNELAFMYGY